MRTLKKKTLAHMAGVMTVMTMTMIYHDNYNDFKMTMMMMLTKTLKKKTPAQMAGVMTDQQATKK